MKIKKVIGKDINKINSKMMFFSCIFFSFIASSYLFTWWSRDVQIIHIIFIIFFSFIGCIYLKKIMTFISNTIQKIFNKTNYEWNKKEEISHGLVPFALSGILSILLFLLYLYIENIRKEYGLVERIHYPSIIIMSFISIFLFFIILISFFKKNNFRIFESFLQSIKITTLFVILSSILTSLIFIVSFIIFTFINLTGGAPFG